jgi:glutamyl-tRNA synthetase
VVPYLAEAGLLPVEPTQEQRAVLAAVTPLVQERINTLSEAIEMLGFLFVDEESFSIEPDAAAKGLTGESGAILEAASNALAELPDWTTEAIEHALRAALVEGLGLKPRNAFGPVRVALTGRRISPPLFESMELLGRDRSLRRLKRARAGLPTD